MKTKAERKAIDSETRGGFYSASDGVERLKSVARETGDPKLTALVAQLEAALNDTRSHLNNTYIWD